MTTQGPVADGPIARAWRGSRCLVARPQHVPGNLLLAATYLGLVGGFWLGILGGVLFGIDTIYSMGNTGYAGSLAGFAIFAGALIGAVTGLTIGVLNGIVLTFLSRTPALRSRVGISRSRVTAAAVLTTGVGGLALLHLVFQDAGGLFEYPPAITASLLAIPMSRRLRLS